ncbi:hypothetical protein J2X46_002067 [Nocardioides sp. BE266]|uniref:hypothetical protein n=1 Tax=Nocardioides sp. BE266 TaxID=2817725 RepID=UPI0028607955|nr:hypothetical protein [Nocardioides sp. BE266]MDR7253082.1 hypothetical protein [Nocardioides sp. BE266]
MTTTWVRRSAAALATALATATLVATGTAPAGATPGCTDETPPNVLLDGCDDSSPPETSVAASVTPNAAGYVNVSTVTFTLSSSVTDADTGPFGFECRLTGTPDPYDWKPCTSPVTLTGLPDVAAGGYVFSARAVDLGDAARNPDQLLGPGVVVDTPDVDQTAVSIAWGQDTKVPFVFVTRSGYDADTPTQPVMTSATVPLRLNSSEPGTTYECTDNGRPTTCTGPTWVVKDPKPGRHVVTARAVDRAGNPSAWSKPVEFFVPRNLTRSKGWSKVRNEGYFRGDALRAEKRGARLVLPRTKVGELRLLAPTGPAFGKVRVRVGRRDWHVVDLSGRRTALTQLVVIDRYSGMRSGRITIESLSSKPVVVDAVVARPNRFPPAD